MARIFISHSSRDNLESIAFHKWLLSIGYARDDVFLDLHSLNAGTRWRDALRAANRRCEAIALLASPASLGSEEVRREIILAEEYNKPILVALLDGLNIDDNSDARLTPYRDRQLVDLTAEPRNVTLTAEHKGKQKSIHFSASSLARIKARLDELGLDASNFSWEPANFDEANPFPGLHGYEEKDAGVFFGRDPEIARGLAKLRELAATDDGRLPVIQASSGAGKSSFLKAGLWPRLRRDSDFEVVAILRPAGGMISGATGLARALSARLAADSVEGQSPVALARALLQDTDVALKILQDALVVIAQKAAVARQAGSETATSPALVFGVDQAEELFAAADIEESRAFMALLARLAEAGPVRPIFVLTLREDSIGALQAASANAELPPLEPILLPPIPRESFIQVIQEPARIAREAGLDITIEPDLAQVMINDSRGRDALPLLSVMLEQMIEDHRVGRRLTLTLEGYERQGGLGARLGAARREAAAVLPAAAEDTALRQIIVPNLATWDAEAEPPGAKRLVAREAEIIGDDAGLRLLADKLVEKHLLTRSTDECGAATLEVAHEAMLRQAPISVWLENDKDFLAWLANITRARQLDEVNIGQLVFGARDDEVQQWLAERRGEIPAADIAFVEASIAQAKIRAQKELEEERRQRALQEAELEAAREREAAEAAKAEAARRVMRRTFAGLATALVFAIAAGWFGYQAVLQSKLAAASALEAQAEAKRAQAERDKTFLTQSRYLAGFSEENRRNFDIGNAVALARRALPTVLDNPKSDRLAERNALSALYYSYSPVKRYGLKALVGHTRSVNGALQLADGRLLTWSGDNTARLWSADGAPGPVLKGHTSWVSGAMQLADGRLLTWSEDNTARLWPLERELLAWADRIIEDLKPLHSIGERCRYYLESADTCQGVNTERFITRL